MPPAHAQERRRTRTQHARLRMLERTAEKRHLLRKTMEVCVLECARARRCANPNAGGRGAAG